METRNLWNAIPLIPCEYRSSGTFDRLITDRLSCEQEWDLLGINALLMAGRVQVVRSFARPAIRYKSRSFPHSVRWVKSTVLVKVMTSTTVSSVQYPAYRIPEGFLELPHGT